MKVETDNEVNLTAINRVQYQPPRRKRFPWVVVGVVLIALVVLTAGILPRIQARTDLKKETHRLIQAYDDPLGVTAAFDRNILARLNRELDADFVLENFEHVARFNENTGSIEMHLRSKVQQTVNIPAADLMVSFRAGETIWTESSHKFTRGEICQLAKAAHFELLGQWIDQEWPFAESLLIAK